MHTAMRCGGLGGLHGTTPSQILLDRKETVSNNSEFGELNPMNEFFLEAMPVRSMQIKGIFGGICFTLWNVISVQYLAQKCHD